MDIRDVREAIVPEIHEGMFFLTADYPMASTGSMFERLSEMFQGLAICHFLATMDIDKFRENLVRSGHSRRFFLRKSQEEGNLQDRYLALSRSEAFLDSLVAGDLQLAREITIFSSETWNKNWEYEDDFCFFLFLQKVVKNPNTLTNQDLRLILEQFEHALEGQASNRLDVCNSLLARDEEAFNKSLYDLLEENSEQFDKKRPTISDMDIESLLFWPKSYISIEGLALLRIAEIVGLQTEGEFPLCPMEARLSILKNYYIDLFSDLERALAADSADKS